MDESGTFAFQGAEGEIYLDSLENGEASGRIAVTLREITSDERVRYAGVFSRIPVTALPQEYCDQMASAIMPPDTTATDAQ